MRAFARAAFIVIGSVAYWIYAPALPFGLRELFFPDCYVHPNPQMCDTAGFAIQVGGFIAIGVIYSLFLWWALRLFR